MRYIVCKNWYHKDIPECACRQCRELKKDCYRVPIMKELKEFSPIDNYTYGCDFRVYNLAIMENEDGDLLFTYLSDFDDIKFLWRK